MNLEVQQESEHKGLCIELDPEGQREPGEGGQDS